LSNTPPGDDTAPGGGCVYTEEDHHASHTKRLKQQRLSDLIRRLSPPNSRFGYFHLRRGDTTQDCDTSLGEVKSFLACSFNGAEEPVTAQKSHLPLLFGSDEQDAEYRRTVLGMTDDDFPHVSILEMDLLALQVVQEGVKD
jgi:hypothetical protein